MRKTKGKKAKSKRTDWDNVPSPNPRYKGLTVLEAARQALAGKKHKLAS